MTLVDLLDRLLDKGLVIHADVIISVAGIPLVGVNLRAALAGMETMLAYGMMKDWDATSRGWEAQHRTPQELSLPEGETLLLRIFGSYDYRRGIYTAWRSGWIHLTDQRLLLFQPSFREVIVETPLEEIEALGVRDEPSVTGTPRPVLYLVRGDGRTIRLSTLEIDELKAKLGQALTAKGRSFRSSLAPSECEEPSAEFLMADERIVCQEKVWHLLHAKGILGEIWKPGMLYLTNRRLCWWYSLERRLLFEVSLQEMSAVATEVRDVSGVLKQKRVLDVIYQHNGSRDIASFSGKEIGEWEQVLKGAIRTQGAAPQKVEEEACPRCGHKGLVRPLLEKGCARCGWVSPRLKKQVAGLLKA